MFQTVAFACPMTESITAWQTEEVKPAVCPCCKQTIPPASSNREWTVEEILAREG